MMRDKKTRIQSSVLQLQLFYFNLRSNGMNPLGEGGGKCLKLKWERDDQGNPNSPTAIATQASDPKILEPRKLEPNQPATVY
jgi:hypothetical protein